MKSSILAISLFLVNSVICFGQNIESAPDDKAVVYFVIKTLTGADDLYYFDSKKIIGKCRGKNYFRYECEAGEHVFFAKANYPDFIEADIEAGKIYFVEVQSSNAFTGGSVYLFPLDPNKNPKRLDKIFKFMEKKPPKSFTKEDLVIDNEDKVIGEILNEYWEWKTS